MTFWVQVSALDRRLLWLMWIDWRSFQVLTDQPQTKSCRWSCNCACIAVVERNGWWGFGGLFQIAASTSLRRVIWRDGAVWIWDRYCANCCFNESANQWAAIDGQCRTCSEVSMDVKHRGHFADGQNFIRFMYLPVASCLEAALQINRFIWPGVLRHAFSILRISIELIWWAVYLGGSISRPHFLGWIQNWHVVLTQSLKSKVFLRKAHNLKELIERVHSQGWRMSDRGCRIVISQGRI